MHFEDNKTSRRDHLKWMGAAGLSAAGLPALGQTSNWPDKPVRWIVPFAPGGAVDNSGRLMAERLSRVLKVPVITLQEQIILYQPMAMPGHLVV